MPGALDPEALLPAAVAWAAEHERMIERSAESFALDAAALAFAREIGVAQPERVRVRPIHLIPRPTDPGLVRACEATGLMQGAGGLCLRYGIYINTLDLGDPGLLAHELVHTLQYERFGGIEGFLRLYFAQVLAPGGYDGAPLEVEARTLAKGFNTRRVTGER